MANELDKRLSKEKIDDILKDKPEGCSKTLKNNFINQRAKNLDTSLLKGGSKEDNCLLFSSHFTDVNKMLKECEVDFLPPNKVLKPNILVDKKTQMEMKDHAFQMVIWNHELLLGIHLIPDGKHYEQAVVKQKEYEEAVLAQKEYVVALRIKNSPGINLHMTLAFIGKVESSRLEEIKTAATKLGNEILPLKIKLGDEDFFGEKNDVPVRRAEVGKTEEIRKFYLEYADKTHPHFNAKEGPNFHVSQKKDAKQLYKGQKFKSREIYIKVVGDKPVWNLKL